MCQSKWNMLAFIYMYTIYIHTVIGCVCPLNMGKETDTQQAEQPYLSKLSKLRAAQTFALTARYKTGRSVNTFPLSPLQPHLSMYITFWGMADKGRGCGAPCCLPWLQQAKVLSIKKLFDFVAWQVARAALLASPPTTSPLASLCNPLRQPLNDVVMAFVDGEFSICHIS